MQLASIAIELGPLLGKFVQFRPTVLVNFGWQIEASFHFKQDRTTVRFTRVTFQTEITQPAIFQTLLHNLKGRDLFTDEQNLASNRQCVGDDVRDRLTLARARRPIEHKANALACRSDRFKLAGIAIENCFDFPRCQDIIQFSRRRDVTDRTKRFIAKVAFVTTKDAAMIVAHHGMSVLPQVLPHRDFGECESPNRAAVFDFPTIVSRDRGTDFSQKGLTCFWFL